MVVRVVSPATADSCRPRASRRTPRSTTSPWDSSWPSPPSRSSTRSPCRSPSVSGSSRCSASPVPPVARYWGMLRTEALSVLLLGHGPRQRDRARRTHRLQHRNDGRRGAGRHAPGVRHGGRRRGTAGPRRHGAARPRGSQDPAGQRWRRPGSKGRYAMWGPLTRRGPHRYICPRNVGVRGSGSGTRQAGTCRTCRTCRTAHRATRPTFRSYRPRGPSTFRYNSRLRSLQWPRSPGQASSRRASRSPSG